MYLRILSRAAARFGKRCARCERLTLRTGFVTEPVRSRRSDDKPPVCTSLKIIAVLRRHIESSRSAGVHPFGIRPARACAQNGLQGCKIIKRRTGTPAGLILLCGVLAFAFVVIHGVFSLLCCIAHQMH